MIIVEGMDNSGKTTAVNFLHSETGIPISKSAGPIKDEKEACKWTSIMLKLNPLIIFDRFFVISEEIYGPPLRGRNVLKHDPEWRTWYMDRLVMTNSLIIYCRPPIEKIMDMEPSNQMRGVYENAKMLTDRYDHLMSKLRIWGMSVVVHDFTAYRAQDALKWAAWNYLKLKGVAVK